MLGPILRRGALTDAEGPECGGDGMLRWGQDVSGCHGSDTPGRGWHVSPELTAFLILQVLYKTAWSESVGRDCAAFCAKKWV